MLERKSLIIIVPIERGMIEYWVPAYIVSGEERSKNCEYWTSQKL